MKGCCVFKRQCGDQVNLNLIYRISLYSSSTFGKELYSLNLFGSCLYSSVLFLVYCFIFPNPLEGKELLWPPLKRIVKSSLNIYSTTVIAKFLLQPSFCLKFSFAYQGTSWQRPYVRYIYIFFLSCIFKKLFYFSNLS